FDSAALSEQGVLELAPGSPYEKADPEERHRAVARAFSAWSKDSRAASGLVLVRGREERTLYYAKGGEATPVETWGIDRAVIPPPKMMFFSGGATVSVAGSALSSTY